MVNYTLRLCSIQFNYITIYNIYKNKVSVVVPSKLENAYNDKTEKQTDRPV